MWYPAKAVPCAWKAGRHHRTVFLMRLSDHVHTEGFTKPWISLLDSVVAALSQPVVIMFQDRIWKHSQGKYGKSTFHFKYSVNLGGEVIS